MADNGTERSKKLLETEKSIFEFEGTIRKDWRFPGDRRVQQACLDVLLLPEFVQSYDSEKMDNDIKSALRRDEEYAAIFVRISPKIVEFNSCLIAIAKAGSTDELCAKLRNLADEVLGKLDEAIQAFVRVVDAETAKDVHTNKRRASALRIADNMIVQLTARRLIDEAQQASTEAQQARDETEQLVFGGAGPKSLGHHYQTYADKQITTANRLRWAVAGMLALIPVFAASFILLSGDLTIGGQLVKLSTTIPFAVLAGYLHRESLRHRAASKWSAELAIALHTLHAYTDVLDPGDQSECRRVLGMRIFSSTGTSVAGSTKQEEASLFSDLESLLEKVDQILRRVWGTSEPRRET